MSAETEAKLLDARSRLPLKRLMEQYGDSPRAGGWRSFACPFCGKKGASVREWRGREFFKCWKVDCSSGTSGPKGAFDEIAYIAHKSSTSRQDAFKTYLKMAGVWKEERLAPSVLPGQRARRKAEPKLPTGLETPKPVSKPQTTGLETPQPVSKPVSEPVSKPSEPVSKPVSEPVSKPSEPVSELIPNPDGVVSRPVGGRPRSDNETMLKAAAYVVVKDQKASAKHLKRIFSIAFRRAAEVVEELERWGVIGPIEGQVRKILMTVEQLDQLFGGLPAGGGSQMPAAPSDTNPGRRDGSPAIHSAKAEMESPTPADRKTPGEAGVVGPHSSVSAASTSSPPVDGPPSDQQQTGGESDFKSQISNFKAEGDREEEDLPEDEGASQAMQVLEAFYKRLALSDEDKQLLWEKRGLTPGICRSLRSNPQSNVDILKALAEEFPRAALLASGLWVQEYGKESKPNAQFYGWGIIGKKEKTGEGSPDFQWGWCHPILIPYYDDRGRLTLIRPHKGMLRGKSAQLYVPEPLLPNQQEFETAIICEGEFKALACLQVFGVLINPATGKAAFGSCSLPGITMSKRQGGGWWVRDAMDRWLQASGARQVVVAFDSEEKADPKLPGYKADVWKRHETVAWALYLADQLTRDGYDARVLVLPKEWRDENGKADWDGALAKLVKEV